jgi:excisionase family DNA binding protein
MQDSSLPALALRPREAAKALGISVRTLWQMTKNGIIPSVTVGGNQRRIHLYPVSLLQDWLTRQAATSKVGA